MPFSHALPRALVYEICEDLGYDLDDVDQIVITPHSVRVTVMFPIGPEPPPTPDPWAQAVGPDPFLRDDEPPT